MPPFPLGPDGPFSTVVSPAADLGGKGMAILTVGQGQQYATIEAAVTDAAPGDTIDI
jgi:hypothetical protein